MDYSWVLPENIIDRLDSLPYKRVYIDNLKRLKKHKTQKLFKICDSVKCGPFGSTVLAETYSNEGVLYIRPVNISNNLFDESDLVFLDRLDVRKKNLDIFTNNDLFFGRVGNPCVSKVSKEYSEITISPNIIGVKVGDKIDSDYLWMFLSSRYGIFQIERMLKTVAQPTTSTETIKELDVLVPLPEIQKYIGDKVRKAEELREEAKTLQKEIDILLEVDMLLKEETDKVYNIYDSKINWTNEINIEDRIDPNFYQKKYISTIEKLGNNKVRLEKYVRITKIRYQTGNINKYIEISSINNSFGTIDEVEELRPEEIPTSAKYQVKEGDILVSLVRPTRKAISIVTKEYDNAICTGGFAVLQSKGKVPVEFLTAVLRTNFVGIQFERYCAGSTYPTINEDDVVKVFIPMYSENQINKITENYRRIIDNIYTSKKLIEEAKQDVEDLIEGNFDMSKVKANS